MKMIFFNFILMLLTVFRVIFSVDCNINYNILPIDFDIESVSDIYVPSDKNSTLVSEYPTIIQLCHQKNSEDNGKLLATFEKW